MSDLPETQPPSPPPPNQTPAEPRVASQSLFGDGNRVWIEHAGRSYALFITRQGKLILTR